MKVLGERGTRLGSHACGSEICSGSTQGALSVAHPRLTAKLRVKAARLILQDEEIQMIVPSHH
jgi:hypothetical protein